MRDSISFSNKILSFLIFFFSLFFYGIYIYNYDLTFIKPSLSQEGPPGLYDYKGLTHVHSNISTGSGSPEDIIQIAKESQMDFMFFTEVNYFEPHPVPEGYIGNLFILTGGEYSYLDSRILYYDRPFDELPDTKGQFQVFLAHQLSQSPTDRKGLLNLAHPLHRKFKWNGEIPDSFNSIEVVNLKQVLDSAWLKSKFFTISSLLIYLVNPDLGLLLLYDRPSDEIQLWNKLNHKKKVFSVVGTDATAKAVLFEGTSIKFPSYLTSFRIASNHLLLNSELTGDLKSDKKKLLSALKLGRSYMSLDILGNPKGFWTYMNSDGQKYQIGSDVPLAKDSELTVQIPSLPRVPFEVQIYKDGLVYFTATEPHVQIPITSKGVYRVQVDIKIDYPFPFKSKMIPWIYSNPFRVGLN